METKRAVLFLPYYKLSRKSISILYRYIMCKIPLVWNFSQRRQVVVGLGKYMLRMKKRETLC